MDAAAAAKPDAAFSRLLPHVRQHSSRIHGVLIQRNATITIPHRHRANCEQRNFNKEVYKCHVYMVGAFSHFCLLIVDHLTMLGLSL